MSSSTALTLTSQAAPSRSRTHAPAYWHSTLVSSTDSLPYYDREWDQGSDTLQAQVEQEIDAELQRMGKQGRKAAEKRLGKEFQFSQNLSELVKKEMERVVRREAPMGGIDMSRYTLLGPTEANTADEIAWDASLRNSKVQLAHQSIRATNLELLKTYGANAWRISNFTQEKGDEAQISRALQEVRDETNSLNRKRKEIQIEVGEKKLAPLERKWRETVSMNLQIEVANVAAAMEIRQLKHRKRELEKEVEQLEA